MFTQRHFEKFAEMIARMPYGIERGHVRYFLLNMCKEDNPKFKQELFDKRIAELTLKFQPNSFKEEK